MANILRFIGFLAILISVLLGFQYYILHRLSAIFQFTCPAKVSSLVFILIPLNFIAISIVSRTSWNIAVQIWYDVSAIVIGSILIFFTALLCYHGIQKIVPIPLTISQAVVSIGLVSLLGYSLFTAQHLTVKTVEIPTAKVKRKITIVQISDLHLGIVHGKKFLDHVVARVKALHPELVLITGDLFDGIGDVNADTLQALNTLAVPTFFIVGNHDMFVGLENALAVLSQTRVTVLRNEKTVWHDTLQLVGLDYFGMRPQNDQINKILQTLALDNRYFTILLEHVPFDFQNTDHSQIDLQLAGHTHAGQIFPWSFFVKYFYPSIRGLMWLHDHYLYVSSGTGTWGPPMRLGTWSEITVIRVSP